MIVWLVIFGLATLVWMQSQHIGALRRRLTELERHFGVADDVVAAPETPREAPMTEPLLLDTPLPPDDREPLLLDTPLPPDEQEPLLLDTPLPEASNDDEIEPVPALTGAVHRLPEPAQAAAAQGPEIAARTSPTRMQRLERWITEKGWAWIGGGAGALVTAYVVGIGIAQLAPTAQLICVIALGAALLGASEWTRRTAIARPRPIVAACLAGAGVLALYGAVWLAHGVHGMIGIATATTLLVLCAGGLIGLSILHGQVMSVLAVAAALLAPALTHPGLWPTAGLTLFICAVSAGGFSIAALRRWSWVAVVTVAGLYCWFGSAIADDQIRRAWVALSFASLGCVFLALRPARDVEERGFFSWRRAHLALPAVATSISSVLLIWVWLATSPAPTGLVAGPAWVGSMFVALAAATVRLRVAAPATLAIAVAALVVGFMAYLRSRFFFGPLGADFYPFVLFAALVVAASALLARPNRHGRTMVAIAGAGGSALLIVLAAFSREAWHSPQAWAPLLIGAPLLFAAAWRAEQYAKDAEKDRAVGVWAGAGAVLLLLGIESAFPAEARTTAHAGATLLLASGLAWRNWRVLGYAALGAALLAIGYALSPALLNAAIADAIPIWGALTILATTVILLMAAGAVADRAQNRPMMHAMLTGAGVIVVLIGAFLVLRWIAASVQLDRFAEEALRALLLLGAGHALMGRPAQEPVGRWRGHVLMGLGFAYALVMAGLVLNPWWGQTPARVLGPPIFDTLLLAFAAPAVLAGFAGYRVYAQEQHAGRVYVAVMAAFGLIWGAMETRRLFHGASLEATPVGVLEGACYALIALVAALWIALYARAHARVRRPFPQDVVLVNPTATIAAIVVAGLIMLIVRHPWWGGQAESESMALGVGLAVLAQAAAVAMALTLGWLHNTTQTTALPFALMREPARAEDSARFAAAAGVALFGWSFGHGAIRWFYHQGAMDDGNLLSGLEGYAHAIWPLVFVLAAWEATERASAHESIRAFVSDLQAIWASAIWAALGFAALGLCVLFNPWWGLAPVEMPTGFSLVLGMALLVVGAVASFAARRIDQARWAEALPRATTILCIVYLFVALTILVRWIFHRGDMTAPSVIGVELWTYPAVWALFGAFTVAWFSRTFRPEPPQAPGDLLQIKPSGRRERRHGRRQRTP
ncbi:DUF2339 domain-containing protein [Terricaulis silvestris]|uniref:Putative membrane protein n=1 Tax=Terricaulis silvestris TaxID=2686094 RepID=A0A6I6MPF3_9CAUL|nr:DUF2339 domain-containing protein [Terricaulis silvestris]QGZ93452.1 putative membrane protein [Terricaulis silvestris]